MHWLSTSCSCLTFSLVITTVAVAEGKLTLDQSGQGSAQRVSIENPYLRLVINPSAGGRIESFVHKRSKQELTMPLGETVPGGLLSDHVWQQNFWHGDWTRAPYAVKVLEQNANKVVVELTSPPGDTWEGIAFRKTITVWAEKSAVKADYTMTSNEKANERARPDFYFHQALAGRGTVFLPAESGVLARPLSQESESWVYDPSRGWLGYIRDNGTGLGAAFDFKRVLAYRTSQTPCMTMEWLFRKADFKPGASEKTSFTLGVFDGLKRVSAVGEMGAVELQVGERKGDTAIVRVAMVPFESCRAKLTLTVLSMTDGRKLSAIEKTINARTDSPVEVGDKLKLPGDGNWIVRGTLEVEGRTPVTFEQPVFASNGNGTYAMSPEENRIPEFPDGPTWSRYKPIDFTFNSTAIPTPHRVWAKPYAGGRPRVLALLPEGADREAVELMQRFDMDITTAFLVQNTYYVLGDSVRALKLEAIHKHLDEVVSRDYDVIVFSPNNVWGLLTPNAKQKIIEKVKAGTGLILVQRGKLPDELDQYSPFDFLGYDHAVGTYTLTGDGPPFLNALPYAAMPTHYYSNGAKPRLGADGKPVGPILLRAVLNGADRGPLLATSQIGKGRFILSFTEGNIVPSYGKFRSHHNMDVLLPAYDYWEYHYAMIARMIYWAAQKESPVTLLSVEGSEKQVDVALNSKSAGPAKVDLTVRDRFGDIVSKTSQGIELKTGEQSVALPIEGAFGGAAHIADVIVYNTAGVLAFGGGTFPTNSVRIASLAPEKPVVAPTENTVVVAKIEGELPSGAVLRAQLFDGRERLVATTEAAATAETKLSLPVARASGLLYQVRATLAAGSTVLAQLHCEGRIAPRRDTGRYRAFFWGGVGAGVPENIVAATYDLYESMGINANWLGETHVGHDARFMQQRNMPYSHAAVGMRTAGGVTKQQSLTNKVEVGNAITAPDAVQGYFKEGAARAARSKDEDVLVYSCADENRGSGKDVDFSESGKKALREWLKKYQYKDLAALNAEWATDFKSWDDVIAMTEDEAKEHFKNKQTCAPWLDQRMYMAWGAAQLAKGITDGVRSVDPTAIVGESGSQEPYVYGTDRDWWHMARSYTGLGAYGGVQTIQHETYNPTMIRYSWSGYGKPNPINRAAFYRILGNFDKGMAIFASRSHIDPDFTLPESGRSVQGTLIELQRGIGQMFVSAKPEYDPVYILQSHASVMGSYMLGCEPLNRSSRYAILHVLGDLGIKPRYISYEQLASGHLAKTDARVLFLPATVALSPAEVAAIRTWVKAGGTVVGDLKTALMTAHGKMYPKPELDDVFGIDRASAELTESDKDSPWTGNDNMGTPVLRVPSVERGITATANAIGRVTGARGTVPIVFQNNFGNGRAYYFAADILAAYEKESDQCADPETPRRIQFIQGLFEKILGEAGVAPPITVHLRDPKTGELQGRCPWVWLTRKTSGDMRYFALLRDYTTINTPLDDVPVSVEFTEPGYIYDVVAGRFLGRGNRVNLTMVNCTGRVFAVLPYEVTGIKLPAPSAPTKRGADLAIPVEVATSEPAADPRVLRVDVTTPGGKPHRLYSTDLRCKDSRGTVTIPFALNDPVGDWRVRVTDVVSGVANEITVRVQ